MAVIEIEVDHRLNRNLSFTPIQAVVRGRLDCLRGDAALREHADKWPGGVAGQRIGFDTETNVGYVAEPLQDPEHAAVRAKVEKAGYTLPEKRREFKGPGDAGYDWAATWLYWIRRVIDAGHAKIVKGKLPTQPAGNVRKNFVTQDPQKLRSAENNLLAVMLSLATPEQRAEFDRRRAELAK